MRRKLKIHPVSILHPNVSMGWFDGLSANNPLISHGKQSAGIQ
jgi:hypothetical protein